MNDKQRLNRVRWVKSPSTEEGVSAKNNPTPWSAFPIESTPRQEEGPGGVENNPTPWSAFQQGNAFGVENNPTPWSTFQQGNLPQEDSSGVENNPTPWSAYRQRETISAQNNPTPWETPPEEDLFYQEEEMPAGNAPGEDEGAFSEENLPADYDPLAEEFYEEDIYDEEEALLLEEQRLLEEAERRTLRDALLILVALYIVCGIAPLFMGLFVPLRIFFWLEIGGWVIIIAWLVIGVRRPLTRWFKERARKRREQEQTGEQIAG